MITLKTLAQATAQEVFDQAAEHLLKQSRRSASEAGGCMYRGENGLKCAAGCFIADDEYCSQMEGAPWDTLARRGIVDTKHCVLIHALQCVHDSYVPARWWRMLRGVAERFNLNPNVLDDNRTNI